VRIRRVLAAVIFGVLSACFGEKTTAPLTVGSVSLTNASGTLQYGQTVRLTASVLSVNGSALTGRPLTWSSSNDAIASVSSTGLVTGGAVRGGSAETATITVTSDGKSASAAVTVAPISVYAVAISLAQVAVYVGQTVQLGVTVKDVTGGVLTGRAVTWSSALPTIATVSSQGLVTAVAAGTATITATVDGKSTTASVTVALVPVSTVTVTPSTGSLFVGQTLQLSASAKDSTGNTLTGRAVTWSSASPTIATVSSQGLVTAIVAGTVSVTARVEEKTGSTTIQVARDSLAMGLHAHFTFAGTINDAQSNVQSTAVGSLVYVKNRKEQVGSSIAFTGASHIQLRGLAIPQSFSIATWVRIPANTNYGTILLHQNILLNSMGRNETGCLRLYIDRNAISCNQALRADRWTHIVATYDAGTTKASLYVDGKIQTSGLLPPVNNGSSISYIGASGTVDHLNGTLDDLRIYQRVLIPSEVSRLAEDIPRQGPDALLILPGNFFYLNVGTSREMTSQVVDRFGNNAGDASAVQWTISDTSVASIQDSRYVQSRRAGTTYVIARLGTLKDSALMVAQSFQVGTPQYSATGLNAYFNMSMPQIPSQNSYGYSAYTSVTTLTSTQTANEQYGWGPWFFPNITPNPEVQSIEGGAGRWKSGTAPSRTPKFRLNATPDKYRTQVGSTGWDFDQRRLPFDKIGVAQLSNSVLVPPDGLPFNEAISPVLLGYAWMGLPIISSYITSATSVGDLSWTLLLRAANFSGPVAFYIPALFADGAEPTSGRGTGMDAKPSILTAASFELGNLPIYTSYSNTGVRYRRVPAIGLLSDQDGRQPLLQDFRFYARNALYDPIKQWKDAGIPVTNLDQNTSYVGATRSTGAWMRFLPENSGVYGFEEFLTSNVFENSSGGLAFGLERQAASKVNRISMPEYFVEYLPNSWRAIPESAVPSSTYLLGTTFPELPRSAAQSLDFSSGGAWDSRYWAAGPFSVTLNDGSTVDYVWYKFIDQPAIRSLPLSPAERSRIQSLIESMHGKNLDGIAPPLPTSGKLATLDPRLIVRPPVGLEIGYVPIVIKQY
jgi:uncharacterized protein YjdB